MPTLASLVLEIDSSQAVTAKPRMDALGASADGLGENMDKLTKKQDAFLQSLDRQAATAGKGAAALRAYKAEQLGLTDDTVFQRLNGQINDTGKSANAAVGGITNFGDTMERVAIRSAARFLVMGLAVQGTVTIIKELTGASSAWDKANRDMADFTAQGGIAAGGLAKSLRDENDSLNAGVMSVDDARRAHERMALTIDQLRAISPEYRDALSKENMTLQERLDILTQLNNKDISQLESELKKLEAKGPESGFWASWAQGLDIIGAKADAILPKFLGSGGNTGLAIFDLPGAISKAGKTSDLENQKKYIEEWKKLSKDIADLRGSNGAIAGLNGKNTPAGTEDTSTQYGKELDRLNEQLYTLESGERNAYEMKVRLMDNASKGSVDEALGLWDQVQAYKALAVAQKAEQKDADALGSLMNQYVHTYEAVGKSAHDLALAKLQDAGATKEQTTAALGFVDAAAAAQSALDAQNKLAKEAASMNEKHDYATESAHLNDLKGAGLNLDVYAAKQHALLLQSNTVWGAMAYSIENFADRGSDALASFLNGTKTGFRAMVDGLLVDMERLIIKQQIVAPFLNDATKGFPNLLAMFGSSSGAGAGGDSSSAAMSSLDGRMGFGGFASGLDYVPQDMIAMIHQGEAIVPKEYNGIGKTGGGTSVQSSVAVTINNNGTPSVQAQTTAGGAQMGREMEAAVTAVIVKHQRPGGLLNPV